MRVRLTFWYISALAVILFIYSGLIYGMLRNHLFSEIDRKLREDVESTEELLVDYETEPKALNENRNRETWLLEVWRRGEKKVFSSPMADKSPLGDLSGECKEEKLQYDSTKLSDGLHVRYGCKMTVVNGNHYVIRAARSADRVHEELRQVFLMMALGLPVALLASAVGGYALARRALQPVSRMTDQARSISADKLGERLAVENPNDELGRLATTFNQTFERLERSFEQMRRFSSDASHERRTPLTAMRTMGEVALREKHTESITAVISACSKRQTGAISLIALVLSRRRGKLKLIVLNRPRELARDVIRPGSSRRGQAAENFRPCARSRNGNCRSRHFSPASST